MDNKKKFRVLVVDDSIDDIDAMMGLLKQDYMVIAATNGERAISLANKHPQPDIILLDVDMPEIDGYEVCRRLKENSETSEIPILFVMPDAAQPSDFAGIELGAMDYLVKPLIPNLAKARVKNCLDLIEFRTASKNTTLETANKTQAALIETIGKLVDYRRSKSGNHIKRTQLYVKRIAQSLLASSEKHTELNESLIEQLYCSAPLYDIGMMAIRDDIVLSSKQLNDAEFERVQQHTNVGQQILEEFESSLDDEPFIKLAKEMVATHHERWDGTGYPLGLKEGSIPLSGRIVAIADVYDALISKRAYSHPVQHAEAVKTIREGSGSQFDPELVEIFLSVEPKLRDIALLYSDHDEERDALKEVADGHRASIIRQVLVVEDNEIMLAVVQSQFENMGFVVSTALNGEEAMALINQANFYDLVLTDINMPVMNGYELLRTIQEVGLGVPVVAMTAGGQDLTSEKSHDLGFAASLVKPFDEEKIREVISSIGNSGTQNQ
ncbi:hypothetical protein VIN01S_15780 [Vibrio inusitatus NBRC 102082]|uniref:Two-component system response regulator n=1 Tax=Vibrio inusitatus NBRC 102082 TaxID=1219070 RepID=A0A4Y3HWX5_9VIBR|nr:response regulator [Vibrio inusitatus]GEA50774.1 hypothetical protein VIN01S_15780 [Vibrio inusitatus NBRC 102082]